MLEVSQTNSRPLAKRTAREHCKSVNALLRKIMAMKQCKNPGVIKVNRQGDNVRGSKCQGVERKEEQ